MVCVVGWPYLLPYLKLRVLSFVKLLFWLPLGVGYPLENGQGAFVLVLEERLSLMCEW